VDDTKWDDRCGHVKILSLSVHAQSRLYNLFHTIFISKEVCIVLKAEPSGLSRPPAESDENLVGEPEMLLSRAVGQ